MDTINNVSKLHETINENNLESDSDYTDSECSENCDINFGKKNVLKIENKPETMLYIFTRFENLQNECIVLKTKNYKLKCRLKTKEEKEHIKNLEYSNIILRKLELQEDLDLKNKILNSYKIKMYSLLLLILFIFVFIFNYLII